MPDGAKRKETPAERVMRYCRELATITALPDGLSRSYLTSEHQRANAVVGVWMHEAGLEVRVDEVGNIRGTWHPDPAAPLLVIGSHLDSVVNGGIYDGPLGVLLAIEGVRPLIESGARLPFGIMIVGFGDEEGVRFGATLIGSSAMAGQFPEEWLDLKDAGGCTMETAMLEFGLDVAQRDKASLENVPLAGYLEVHIEQGPVLEQEDLPVGVVTAIAGAERFEVTLRGMAGHAGTVPMDARRDSLTAAAEMIVEVEAAALRLGCVATVGFIESEPGAVNVIPGDTVFSVDVRSGDQALLEHAAAEMRTSLTAIAERRQVAIRFDILHEAAAVAAADRMQEAIASAIAAEGYRVLHLPSGAGHDAMVMASLTDMGMLFVRCEGGISHNPAESVTVDDVAAGLAVFGRLLHHL